MSLLESVERLRAGLDYHFARHNVLTANLVHVDTPGFRAKDLTRRTGFEGALSTAISATSPLHIGAPPRQDQGFRVVDDQGSAPGLDGNSVSIDRESAKLAANNIRYETLATLVTNNLSSLLWAANDGK